MFSAVDTATGKLLWQFQTNTAFKASPMTYVFDGKQHIVIPFTQFWVAEKIAPEAERVYRENSRRGNENAYVTVRVRNGDAALEQLYIDNQPLADYLRAQAAKK